MIADHLASLSSPTVLADQVKQTVILRVRMAFILAKPLGIQYTDFTSSVCGPGTLTVEVFVDPVLTK